MAKSKLLTSGRAKKPVNKSKAEKRAIDERAYGTEEPKIPPGVLTGVPYLNALTWYNRMAEWYWDPEDFVVSYLKSIGRVEESKSIKRVHPKWISLTLCAQARLLERGAVLTEDTMASFEKFIGEALEHENAAVESTEEDDSEKPESPPIVAYRPSVHELLSEKTSEIIGELEGMLDDGFAPGFKLDAWYREKNVNAKIAGSIVDKFAPQALELEEALSGGDEQLKEGYTYLKKKELEKLAETYSNFVLETDRFRTNLKQAKAASKPPKKPDVAKKMRRMLESYLKHSKEFNITSTDPTKIIGAQEVWAFNARYKLLTVFRAGSHGGQLDVSTRKITGFDENLSMTKSIGRKTPDWLDVVMKGTRASLKKVMQDISSTPGTLQDTVNENTVILRVFT